MHKNTKLTPTLRREIYAVWCHGRRSLREIASRYHVDKNVIKTVVVRGKLGDFTLHDSTNHRYRRIEYSLKRLALAEHQACVKAHKRARRLNRYERLVPGELVHGDTKRLPRLLKPNRFRQTLTSAQVLYIWIDDYSRYLLADLLPDRTMWSSAIFLELSALRSPFLVQQHFSDNGSEYKGNSTHAFVASCARLGIQQSFTKIKHPWTNGKAERVIKTLLQEWYYPNRQNFTSLEDQRTSLYNYVEWYNHERPHQGINNLTPIERLALYYSQSGDNA